jgi:hypothetical protein
MGMRQTMRLTMRIAVALLFVPLMASAQYKDLDTALSSLAKGFGSADTQAIISGIAEGDQVNLQFPGLTAQSGFFGRDQASYLLDDIFNKVHPGAFQQTSARKNSAEAQYNITASWTIQNGGKAEARDLYITLRNKNDRWSVVSVRSGNR